MKKIFYTFSLIIISINLHAFKLTPIVADFEISGRGATRTFTLENPGEYSVAIKVSMFTRSMDIFGNEIREDASEDFLVYPSQLILKGKSKKSVRVKWLGKKPVLNELAYRLVAEQLPVNLDKKKKTGTNLNIMLKYVGSVYIVPSESKDEIIVESFQKVKDKKSLNTYAHLGERGKDVLELVLFNKGKKHSVLKKYKFELKSSRGSVIELTEENYPELKSLNLLSGSRIKIYLPLKDEKGDIKDVLFAYESM